MDLFYCIPHRAPAKVNNFYYVGISLKLLLLLIAITKFCTLSYTKFVLMVLFVCVCLWNEKEACNSALLLYFHLKPRSAMSMCDFTRERNKCVATAATISYAMHIHCAHWKIKRNKSFYTHLQLLGLTLSACLLVGLFLLRWAFSTYETLSVHRQNKDGLDILFFLSILWSQVVHLLCCCSVSLLDFYF